MAGKDISGHITLKTGRKGCSFVLSALGVGPRSPNHLTNDQDDPPTSTPWSIQQAPRYLQSMRIYASLVSRAIVVDPGPKYTRERRSSRTGSCGWTSTEYYK